MKVCGNPVRRLDPFQLTKTTLILILLFANNIIAEEKIPELTYKKTPEFIRLLDVEIEVKLSEEEQKLMINNRKKLFEDAGLCCDTSNPRNICWGNCGNNCKCQNMEILIP
jgi:hypothetical protein